MLNLIRSTGGRRPALKFMTHAMAARLGSYSGLRRVEWWRVRRLVFVCSGNICRSPYAAERARSQGLPVASFGVDARGYAPADEVAQSVALSRGVDLAAHVSVGLQDFDYNHGDLLIGLEPKHLTPLFGRSSMEPHLTLLGLWCDRAVPYLPDPYGKPTECFEFVFGLIDEALDNVVKQMSRQD